MHEQRPVAYTIQGWLHQAFSAPGRLRPSHATPQVIFWGLFIAFLALRLPFRAEYLVNWDAVNFALGVQFFDLEHHQPHPPGYIGYIVLGRLLTLVTGEANASLTLLSAVSGALGPAMLFLLACHFMPRGYAAVIALLFGLSPVVWYYSQVALTYSVEMALALSFLWLGYQARKQMSYWHILLATLVLVLLGAVRQSGALFLVPLWLYLVWGFPWKSRFQMTGLLVVGNLAWLIPLVWLAGDPLAYFRASAGLASLAVAPTSVFAMNPFAFSHNIVFVVAGIAFGVNIGLLVILAGLGLRVGTLTRHIRQERMLYLLWLVPALGTYLLIHTGQLGYILLILPAWFLWVGMALTGLIRLSAGQCQRSVAMAVQQGRIVVGGAAAGILLAVFAGANVVAYIFVPDMAYALAKPEKGNPPQGVVGNLMNSKPVSQLVEEDDSNAIASQARQYYVQLNDVHWEELIDLVRQYDPESTVVLAVPDGAGSFRHLTYYLPEYQVYGLGKGLDGKFGHLFTARDGTSNYTVDGLKQSQTRLILPPGVRRVVVPDHAVIRRLDGVMYSYGVTLESGATVAVLVFPADSALFFEEGDGEEARIVLREHWLFNDQDP